MAKISRKNDETSQLAGINPPALLAGN